MSVLPRRLAKPMVTLIALAALVAPAALALALGWIEINYTPWGEQPGPEPTPIEAWVLLALVYLAWAPLVFVGLVFALDRLGFKYAPVERDRRPTDKGRRRRVAGLRFLQSREAPPAGAPQARPKRGAGPSDPPGDGR